MANAKRIALNGVATAMLVACVLVLVGDVWGQRPGSGSRSSTSRNMIALQGFCPVCIVEMKQWVRGTAQNAVVYDGKQYLFPGEEQRAMFQKDPAKYVPALGGDCTVCYAKMGQRMPGSVMYTALKSKRLYLFPAKEQQQEFLANPNKYSNIDLALEGHCAVCKVEMAQDVPGKPEFAVYHQGRRYLFPSDEQRKMFLANPAKYALRDASGRGAMNAPPDSATQLVMVEGKSGCAGCDYGKKPLSDPDELGLAVKSSDGTVYVVEQAHKLYPELYENRFNGMTVKLTGQVLKRDGKFAWVKPSQVSVVN